MLGLIRDVYRRECAVDKILDDARFPTPEVIQDDLLDQVLPVAYSSRPGSPMPIYSKEQASKWLAYIAYRLDQRKTYDLRWWEILIWKSAIPRVMTTTLIVGLGAGLLTGLRPSPTRRAVAGLGVRAPVGGI